MEWWIWILLGLVLLALEVAVPGGIIMLFFGVAALIVGALVGVGFGGPPWFQYLFFSIFAIVSLLTLRGPILKRIAATSGNADKIDTLLGQSVITLGSIAPGEEGKVELRGTTWTARNTGDSLLNKGQKCEVKKVDVLKLFVRSL